MSVIHRFLRQEATWEKLTDANSYTGDTFDNPETISVRWFTETERVEDQDAADGIITLAKTYISTTTAVSTGDRITDENGTVRFVESVRKNRTAKGSFSHYVAALQ
jgi:hypothetical protein